MIWYVKKECLRELAQVPKGDTRELSKQLHLLLEREKAFTVHGYEHSLTPATKKAFQQLLRTHTFVPVKVE